VDLIVWPRRKCPPPERLSSPFTFAGIWEFNRLGGEDLLSAAMIVGEPNPWWEEFTTACRSC